MTSNIDHMVDRLIWEEGENILIKGSSGEGTAITKYIADVNRVAGRVTRKYRKFGASRTQ